MENEENEEIDFFEWWEMLDDIEREEYNRCMKELEESDLQKGNDMKRKKNYVFEIAVCCQGQPFYYYRNTLLGALIEYMYHYLKNSKYGTMNFTLRQKFN